MEQELELVAEHLEHLIRENARIAQDQDTYRKKEQQLRDSYMEKKKHLEELREKTFEQENRRKTLEMFLQTLCDIDGEQREFDEELWKGLLDHILIQEDGAVTVIFRGGIHIKITSI